MFGRYEDFKFKLSYCSDEAVIEIPKDAEAWGLYEVAGADESAARLTEALKECFGVVMSEGGGGRVVSAFEKAKVLHRKARHAEASFGASDSEVREQAEVLLEKFTCQWWGEDLELSDF